MRKRWEENGGRWRRLNIKHLQPETYEYVAVPMSGFAAMAGFAVPKEERHKTLCLQVLELYSTPKPDIFRDGGTGNGSFGANRQLCRLAIWPIAARPQASRTGAAISLPWRGQPGYATKPPVMCGQVRRQLSRRLRVTPQIIQASPTPARPRRKATHFWPHKPHTPRWVSYRTCALPFQHSPLQGCLRLSNSLYVFW